MYDNRMDWWAHERQVHRKEWCCDMDSHEVFTEEKLFSKHMYEQNPDMTVLSRDPPLQSMFDIMIYIPCFPSKLSQNTA